jgi:F-type H+-transporting ATPase subunit epsilon
MSDEANKTFRCNVIDPMGKLLDCQASSAVLPAHDGQIGILYNHMPMLCQLGLGIMKVTVVSCDQYKGTSEGDALFFIDGGFALVASNTVMVVAYDAFALHDLKPEKLELTIERTTKGLERDGLSVHERAHEHERLRVLQKIAKSE